MDAWATPEANPVASPAPHPSPYNAYYVNYDKDRNPVSVFSVCTYWCRTPMEAASCSNAERSASAGFANTWIRMADTARFLQSATYLEQMALQWTSNRDAFRPRVLMNAFPSSGDGSGSSAGSQRPHGNGSVSATSESS
jgi:hypothetical protein